MAFDQYLILCNTDLQNTIQAEVRLVTAQIEAERTRREEEYQHKEEERTKNLKQTDQKRPRKKQHR